MKTSNEYFRFLITLILLLSITFAATAQTGGGFDLSHNIISSGGGVSQSAGGLFAVDGTAGQTLAGTLSFGGAFSLRGGFWAFAANVPTSAGVYISGKVTSVNGTGIGKVNIVLLDTFTNTTRTTVTDMKGNFLFDDLAATHFYIIRAKSKHYIFAPESYALELKSNLEDVNFIGELQQPPGLPKPD